MIEISLKVGELVALFTGDAREYFRTSAKVRADANELDGMEPTIRPKVAETQASRAARTAGKAMGKSVKAGFLSAGVGAALGSSMALAAAAIPAAVGLAGAFGVVAAAGKEVADTMSAYNAAQEAVTTGSGNAMAAQAEFARQFSELTTEGQAFTAQLIQMGPAMDRLGDVAQSSVLPGFTQLLNTSEELFPTVEHGLQAVGGAMSDTAAQAAALAGSEAFQGDLWSAFDQGADITRALGGMVVDLTGDFVNFAGQAQPATAGMVDMIGSLSDGVSSFLSNATPGMEAYGSILRSVGGILDSTLGTAGDLMSMFANEGAPTIARLEQVWGQLLGVVEQFASSGIGPLMGSFGTLLDVLSGLLAVLEPIAPLLGTITGAVLPFVAALKMVDKVTFGGVKKKIRGVGNAIDVAEGKRAKFGAGAKGMIGAVLNPWGLALAGVSLALSVVGQQEQKAAEEAREHQQAVDSLTQAYIEDGYAMGDATRKTIAKGLADKNAADKARSLGISMDLVNEAAYGNTTAMGQLRSSTDQQIRAWAKANGVSGQYVDKLIQANHQMLATGDTSVNLQKQFGAMAYTMDDLTDAETDHVQKLLKMNGVVGESNVYYAEAKQQARQLAAAENQVSVATLKHWNALLKLNNETLKSIGANISQRQATLQLERAHKRAAEALNTHGRESMEYRQAALAEDRAVQQVLTSTYQMTLADKKSLPPQKRKIEALRVQQEKALTLAATYTGPLPKALATFIGGMSRSEAAAHGVTIATNDAGQAVYELPNGHEIVITSNANSVAANVRGLEVDVQRLDRQSASVDIFYKKYISTVSTGMGHLPSDLYRAAGGPVEKGQPYVVGEQGMEMFVPQQNGMIYTASQTAAMYASSAPQLSPQSTSAPASAASAATTAASGGRVPLASGVSASAIADAVSDAMEGMTFVLDDQAGQVMTRVVNKVNKSNARRRG